MDDGSDGNFNVMYQGIGQQTIYNATATNLITGNPYRFYLIAINEAGQSIPSAISTFYACTFPSGLPAPLVGNVTQASVELFWAQPTNDGGCPLAGYSIFRDDGYGGSFTEVQAS